MHIAVGPQSAFQAYRVRAQILPAVRIIVPVQVVVKSALFVFPLVLKSQVAIDDGQAVAAGFGGDGCLAPEFVLGLPEEVAFGVEQFLGGAEVVGDQGIK